MKKSFPTHSVIILRKRGTHYLQESITTNTVLPSSGISEEENRRNVIARLRKDPMVFLVLEPVNGKVDEEVLHPSGFCFHVTIQEGEYPTANLRVTYRDSHAFEENYLEQTTEEDGTAQPEQNLNKSCADMEGDLLSTIRHLLTCIDEEDYSFVSDDCPHFVRQERGEDVDLYCANQLLQEAGFQTERLSVVKYVSQPILIIHENDAVLVGSHFFDGERLFVEMKRFFFSVCEKKVIEAIKKVQETNYAITAFCWGDGSWSFRTDMDEDTDSLNFIEKLNNDISGLREFIDLVEEQEGIEEEPWETIVQQRHFFIHEALAESIKLAAIKV